ncbi:hypothetical protein DFS34DRAFT_435435 [Phlyctochytrium arcticum]|nr:hypothetical protein DFS34DRAFT_435435 [Phlyctochytrium arcticum]
MSPSFTTILATTLLLSTPLLSVAAPSPSFVHNLQSANHDAKNTPLPKTATPPAAPLFDFFARGTQNYVCDANQGKWLLTGADAPLWDTKTGKHVGTHFFVDAVPQWKLAEDGSFIATKAVIPIVSPLGADKAIPWLQTIRAGGSDHGKMKEVGFVARTNTKGGVAPPAERCNWKSHGRETRVPYESNYLFGKSV